MGENELRTWLAEAASNLGVPGVSVGIYHEGAEHYAFHGITSVDAPVDVDENTLFQYGSTGKTFTATAILRLVDRGAVDLDATVRTYVPELELKDEDTAREVTILQLLNHTSGWSGDAHEDFGDGDDALEKFVASMPKLEQVTPLGTAFSYNNAALNLAGRLIEKVTGKTYEHAMKELIIDPLGLERTLYFPNEVMTHRFAAGHRQDADGSIRVIRPWAMSRCSAPAGGWGVSANAGDQIAWAKFHLGDGTAADGTRVLSKELLDLMKQPTFEIGGSALGDFVGISWFLRDVPGGSGVSPDEPVRLASHGGDTLGHHSEFVMVPERNFAVAVLTNCDVIGSQLKEEVVKWTLESYLSVVDRDPEPVARLADALAAYVGQYETIAAVVDITAADGGLVLNVALKPEMAAQMQREGQDVPEQPPIPIGMLESDGDRYIVSDGPARGMKGYFVRAADGSIEAVHVGGRLATRVATPVPA